MDRLTAQDLMSLWPEELGWSEDIGALAILDGRSLLDGDGRFMIERAREEIRRRLHRARGDRGRAAGHRAWRAGARPEATRELGRGLTR